MKWAVSVLLLAFVSLATCLHKSLLGPGYEHELRERVARALAQEARFREVNVVMRQLDVVLFGEVDTPADRLEAETIAQRVWGARARPANNRLRVPARLDAIVGHEIDLNTGRTFESVSIRGQLPESVKADDLPAVFSGVSANRQISSREVGYHPFVGPLPKVDRASLALLAGEFARLPSIGTLELNARGLHLSGDAFASQKQRLEQLAAAAIAPPGVVQSDLRALDLTEPARQALRQVPGLEHVVVRFNEAYATLTGFVASPELRARAAEVVRNLRHAQLREDANQITLGGMFSAQVTRDAQGRSVVALAGLLPDESWKAQLIATLGRLKPDWTVETGGLRFAPSLAPAGWLEKGRFFAFFDEFFALFAPSALRLQGPSLELKAQATPAQRASLGALVQGLQTDIVSEDYELFPSVFHLPGYQRASKVSPEALPGLEEALRGAGNVYFEPGSNAIPAAELPKLDRVAVAVRAAGPGAFLVVGGHTDAAAPPEAGELLSRQRAAAVIEALEQRGIPRAQCQGESFADTRGRSFSGTEEGRRAARRVEILLR